MTLTRPDRRTADPRASSGSRLRHIRRIRRAPTWTHRCRDCRRHRQHVKESRLLQRKLTQESVAAVPRWRRPLLLSLSLSPAVALPRIFCSVSHASASRNAKRHACAHQSTTKFDLIMTSARPSRARDSRTRSGHVTRLGQSRSSWRQSCCVLIGRQAGREQWPAPAVTSRIRLAYFLPSLNRSVICAFR